jgi:hypothetical protein
VTSKAEETITHIKDSVEKLKDDLNVQINNNKNLEQKLKTQLDQNFDLNYERECDSTNIKSLESNNRKFSKAVTSFFINLALKNIEIKTKEKQINNYKDSQIKLLTEIKEKEWEMDYRDIRVAESKEIVNDLNKTFINQC